MRVRHANSREPVRDYPDAIAWIIRERGGGGGHPPRTVKEVSGWKLTQLVGFMFDRDVREVAADLINSYIQHLDAILADAQQEHCDGSEVLGNP